ncbi:MAG: molybdopterin-binding/glycosyltransferase family 2 protein [Proteobacteria bacterium]|nr:molybdopterin-binding/glycosyltransferase family 2 protein [Pseudomonadota bacterium]
MKFAKLALSEAEGAILAHSTSLPKGVLKKGRQLSASDIERLRAAGHSHVTAAQLEAGDVGEDEAARRIARAAAGPGTQAAAPFTGRANIFAEVDGIARIRRETLARINALDEGLTVATVPEFERLNAGQMAATVKIITFAMPDAVIAAAEAILHNEPLIDVAPFAPHAAGLILTRLPGTKTNVLAKRRAAIENRLEALGSRVAQFEIVEHTEEAVAAALGTMQAREADPIIVFAASAIVDRGDVIPAGLVSAGGRIVRLGMPVDPGNLMLLGRLGEKDVIGAPSCAASPKLNGFDWVLERRLAGLEVTSADVAAMGMGGLLKEIVTRPQPRDGSARQSDETGSDGSRHRPRVAAIVLAAGRSTRFGDGNKLLADLNGVPVVRRTVTAALESGAEPVIVVTGHMAADVQAALGGLGLTFVDSPRYREGLSASLKAGLASLPSSIDGVLVILGDMPGVTGADMDRLISGLAPKEGRSIVVPTRAGKRGNPVLFASHLIVELAEIEGDAGAKHVIGRHGDEVAEVEIGSDRIFVDVDTPEALDQVRKAT